MNIHETVHQAIGLLKNRAPGQLIIQFTNHCNALCPQCGMNVRHDIPRNRLDDASIRSLIDAAADKGIQVLSFTGGEPFLFWNKLKEYIIHAGRAGIKYIRTGTNGFLFSRPDRTGFLARVKRLADEMAETPLRNFWISLDSAVPAVHEKMRGLPGVVSGIEQALPVFHERGIYPSANLGINRNIAGDHNLVLHYGQSAFKEHYSRKFEKEFEFAFQSFYRFAIRLGFSMVNACYPMSMDESPGSNGTSAVYAATSPNRVVRFSVEEKAAIFSALLKVVPQFRSQIRIFSPLTSIHALNTDYRAALENGTESSYACRGGVDFFFVDSDQGHAFPCGYRGREDLGRFEDLNLELGSRPDCRQCDWECFRDPSELTGPLFEAFSNPFGLGKRWIKDPRTLKYWLTDLRYTKACGYFNGRLPLNPDALKAFEPKSQGMSKPPAKEVQAAGLS